MKAPRAPSIDTRRTREFSNELLERARVWMPGWASGDVEGDFGRALIEIAARFNSEVAERLDGAGEKLRRGFLDYLGVRGEAARPSRMPVVFKLADTAQEPVLASPPVRMQVDADGASIVFETETETDLRLVPGKLDLIIGVDTDNDAIYFPPPGLSDLQPLEQLPTQWSLKSFASAGATKIQLDPDVGLIKGMIIEAGGRHYRIDGVENGIAAIDPPLDAGLDPKVVVRKVVTFAPFDGVTRNRQEHALYIGHNDLLNIGAAATIDVVGAATLADGITWQYWGKIGNDDEPDWQTLKIIDQKPDALVLLKELKGDVELRKIGDINSRWIRAVRKNLADSSKYFTADALKIRINFEVNSQCPSPASAEKGPTPEAMANTTPLVLDQVFFPLGKLPRQFDAFYLGCEEAFSKSEATVDLCFEMADRTFSALAAVRKGAFGGIVIAGVARDRSLHLLSINQTTGAVDKFRGRGPLQPPRPLYSGGEAKTGTMALDIRPKWRLPVWPENNTPQAGFLVGTSDGKNVWVWREHPTTETVSGWLDFGSLQADGSAIEGLVYLAGTPQLLVALCGEQMFISEWSAEVPSRLWNEVITKDGDEGIKLKSIVPVLVNDGEDRLVTSRTAGMIAISDQNKLFHVSPGGICSPKLSAYDFDPAIGPVAIEIAGAMNFAAVTRTVGAEVPKFVAHDGSAGNPKIESLENGANVIASLETRLDGDNTFHVLATVQDKAGIRITTWAPFTPPPFNLTFDSRVGVEGTIVGAGLPTVVENFVVIPAGRGDLRISNHDTSRRPKHSNKIEIGVVLPDTVRLVEKDLIVRFDDGEPVSREISQPGIAKDGQIFHEIDSPFAASTSGGPHTYSLSSALNGRFEDPNLTLDSEDKRTVVGDYLRIGDEFYEVIAGDEDEDERIATLKTPNHNEETPTEGDTAYVRPIHTARMAPFMRLVPATGGSGEWDANVLNRVPLIFPGGIPKRIRAKAFKIAEENRPELVVLNEEFVTEPMNPADFIVDASFDDWRRHADDTSTNADLSWEYWNGTGWWKLDVSVDETQELKATGVMRFAVPTDIASSDLAGRTNYWIRARLVSGDYGSEEVSFFSQPASNPAGTEQFVKRSTDNVKAPQVLSLKVSYSIAIGLLPKYLLSEDGGTLLDQSDANRTGGAIVEAFIPAGQMLGRLSGEAVGAEIHECLPDCDCQRGNLGENSGPARATMPVSPVAVTPTDGRAFFIGLDANISAGPVSVLLLVEKENDHLDLAPMKVEALVAGQFKPIVADDGTRALGESGVLLMSFAVAPTLSNLFGKTLTWLRLTPKKPSENWIPSIRGAYLNAVFASSKETLTRELLGSSDGSPNLTLRLGRPPVLRDTLELCVREPLGEEERTELIAGDLNLVRSGVEDLPGDWVLWKQVTDPDDEAPTERVYSLDESTGEIRFGDGIHGRIPPIGRNSIVAFGYSRTESGPFGGVDFPANSIIPRTPLNLVSPIESVESVIAADQAAGGAPPESDERVLGNGFARVRHRGRAVSARDLEDLALQSSPDIAQALALVSPGKIRLAVVMKGRRPTPSSVEARELRRFLLDALPVSLRAPRVLRVEGPDIRKLRVELKLEVARLDYAAQMSKWVKDELLQFFDTGLGGVDADGWPLGLNPTEDDIAFVLSDAPLIAGIGDITLRERLADGREGKWPDSIKPTEIVVLDDDPVRITFKTEEVEG